MALASQVFAIELLHFAAESFLLAQWVCVVLSIDFARGAIYLIMSVYVGFNASLMVFPDSLMIMRTPLDFVQDTAGCLLMSQFKQNSRRKLDE